MVLAVDIGNSKIKFGFFDDAGPSAADIGSPIVSCAVSTDLSRSRDEYAAAMKSVFSLYGMESAKLDGVAAASVVPALTGTVISALTAHFGVAPSDIITVGPGVRSGLKIKTENVSALGADIVSNAVAALSLLPPPLVIIDLGTATTITQINESGELCGVAIAAGLRVSARALSKVAAELPEVSLGEIPSPVGKNTADAMNAGTVWSTVFAVDGYISALGVSNAVVTGGSAPLILPYLSHRVDYRPQLCLSGLWKIWTLNREKRRRPYNA